MTEIETIEQEIDALNTERKELQEKYQSKMQEHLKKLTKTFFEQNPQVTAIIWTQYTPYFNDGDTCEFGRNDFTVTNCPLNELHDVSYGEYEGENEDVFVVENFDWLFNPRNTYSKEEREKVKKAEVNTDSVKKFINILESIDDDVYLETFGDHVKVIATAEGFSVDDYSHD